MSEANKYIKEATTFLNLTLEKFKEFEDNVELLKEADEEYRDEFDNSSLALTKWLNWEEDEVTKQDKDDAEKE